MLTKQLILPLKDTYDGKANAVLNQIDEIEKGRLNILHIHGFNDYFFHEHVSDRFREEGYNFFALDLRRYARARMSHQKPFFIKNISEYYEEISLAIEKILELTGSGIVFMGHSTGGLTTPLFTNHFQEKYPIHGLILNSPFFNINLKEPLLFILKMYRFFGNFFPYLKVFEPGDATLNYTKSIHKKYYGEWDYDFDYKLEKEVPLYSGWVKAIMKAQEELKYGLNIKCPTLILHSNKSLQSSKYSPKFQEADVILGVGHMKKYGKGLGERVTFKQIDNAVHDVYLSKPEVREKAIVESLSWLNNNVK